ncbi:TetR/AcrR family transcriptional regulator [Verminephrobacter eiseniae]|uniref:Transcriptional regulator, TetR family n=1 Tax=Verminephrobacter eiseniae (strain EF01-2) TaxID=391735 RepID=A1WQF1_VEREI|nr:TetR/AcrR family transcriptional regulator [Verminephrobacter eiseniae]ABM59858.1 transcriptional regulator, TetR family [Verminephrobacter eiseniae EF01-2]MCW5260219.1 TetR/AcrR family transcriptional regulator [Verminephrobacter eiseniae]MCW5285372.1 TetR/AcrR family transcriptional regulator [Verminephrobacter eiseniae]MCW5303672.1 TetR/AcrR family transcriptional regulator [Verminephrobacter eiseniae]MCW8181319.1 TetR/AcrR family transcriptional regulator [Verminephrobacter eiseniae]
MTDIRQFTNDSAARATTDKDPAPRAPRASRLLKEQGILAQAENHFAQFGFEGASLESIAAAIGISRHKLLYYFPSKEALYQRVLDDVLTQWLASMQDISHSDDPQQALRRYIHAKLHYSRTRPQGVQVFAKEVIAGAPRYGRVIAERVAPLLKTDVRRFARWAREGRIAKVDFTHLMFIIWSVTQAYAELQAQFALLLGKPALTEGDYEKAEALIVRMVLSALAPDAAGPGQAP